MEREDYKSLMRMFGIHELREKCSIISEVIAEKLASASSTEQSFANIGQVDPIPFGALQDNLADSNALMGRVVPESYLREHLYAESQSR